LQAHTLSGKSTEIIANGLEQLISAGYQPTLALVFISINQDIEAVRNLLDKKGITIFGTTTNGEIVNGKITSGAISILLLDLEKSCFSLFIEEFPEDNPAIASAKIAKSAMEKYTNPVFFVGCSHFALNFSNLLKGFKNVIGEDVNVYGGVAGDDLANQNNLLVFTNDKTCFQALVAVVFDGDKVEVKGNISCGWKPVGTVKTITKSNANIVYEIDDKPALDITMRYSGIEDLPDDLNEATLLVSRTMAMQFIKEKGEPVTLMGFLQTSDGSMLTHAHLPEGSQLRFAVPPDFDVVEEVIDRCRELKKEIPEPDALLVYSCSARFDAIGPFVEHEIKGIHNLWNVPMAGFFSNGELARTKGGELEIHNLAACTVALKEK
jgi:hypothetical protein